MRKPILLSVLLGVFLVTGNSFADPITEPATMMLLGFGLVGLGAFGRKKLA